LVSLCLYAHQKLAERDCPRAQIILHHWIHLGFGHQSALLLRMALHGLSQHCDLPPQDVLSFLGAEDHSVLWHGNFSMELGAYLRLKAPQLPLPALNQLIQAISAGPNRLLKKSLRLADEAGFVAAVDVEVADEASGGADFDPAPATDGIGFVVALPGEFGAGASIAGAVAPFRAPKTISPSLSPSKVMWAGSTKSR
jgi:hypothetical protein